MKCPNCGKEIASDSIFCEYCGAKINLVPFRDTSVGVVKNDDIITTDTSISCPNCGKEIASESMFCEYCGAKVSNNQGKERRKGTWWLWVVLISIIAVVIFWVINTQSSKEVYFEYHEEPSPIVPAQTSVDKIKVENLISKINSCSSLGGDYNSLQQCFTTVISPYSSNGETRNNYNIGDQIKNYVGRFPEYTISAPYNFTYVNSSFPLTVKCDIYVTWTTPKGIRKRAWVHKTYYVTSEYKVSGFIDEEYQRIQL